MTTPTAAKPTFIPAPLLPYLPQNPAVYHPGIGLVGCGGITKEHLRAYRAAGYSVVAMNDLSDARAIQRRDEYYPEATVYEHLEELLADPRVQVVDITTHPTERPALILAAIAAGKHVLSQKPFVLDLSEGEYLADMADKKGVRLAVNQNGRWAPHFSYMRHAIHNKIIGEISSVQCSVNWDHNWVKGTPFDEVRHLILYDFAIHWFDILTCFMERNEPRRVFATWKRSQTQTAKPALLANVTVEYDHAQASLFFNGDVHYGKNDTTRIVGEKGTLWSYGPTEKIQQVELMLPEGIARPELQGSWFPDGFHGTMGELLCAIEAGREPTNSARNNLRSLALCFAAVASAELGEPVVPGTVRKLTEAIAD
jgi:predicted dehydrogenase